MSPLSKYLTELRRRYSLRQGELAALIGYEQSYISALEVSLKGPPTAEFVQRLGQVLQLSNEGKKQLSDALNASQRKLTIPLDAEEEVYWLLHDLRECLPTLSTRKVRMMRDLLGIQEVQAADRPSSNRTSCYKEEVAM